MGLWLFRLFAYGLAYLTARLIDGGKPPGVAGFVLAEAYILVVVEILVAAYRMPAGADEVGMEGETHGRT